MKKINYILICTLLLVSVFVFAGCGSKKVVSIAVKNDSEISIDSFVYATTDFVVTYDDGSTETVKGSDLEISIEDAGKLNEAGIYNIDLGYNKQTATCKIVVSASEVDITRPTTACYLYSDSHYVNGSQYTAFCIGGRDETQFLAFEFRLKYDNTKVSNIKITPVGDYANRLEIYKTDSYIAVNFVDSTPGTLNTEMFRVEYTSNELYKNFTLDETAQCAFYKLQNKDIQELKCVFNLNW